MRVSRNDWLNYIRKLSAINQQAAATMQSLMGNNPDMDAEELVAAAFAISEKYGDAAGALACVMYDALAAAQGAAVPPAEPAPNATYGETAKAVYGTLKNKQNTVPATVGRLVKQVGADTMLQNAQRDGAQFAWIPMGDTCAFCLTLASRGWQYMSKKALKNGHAEHIHANCDCEYCIRFDNYSTVEGYDPEALQEKYYSFEGTPDEKINAWRREIRERNKDQINEQKRILYQRRKGLQTTRDNDIVYVGLGAAEQSRYKPGPDERAIVADVVGDEVYAKRIRQLGESEKVASIMTYQARTTLWRRNGTPYEDLIFIDPKDGRTLVQRGQDIVGGVSPTEAMKEMALARPGGIIALHNHPHNMLPSKSDLYSAQRYSYGVVLCHNGTVIRYAVAQSADINTVDAILELAQKDFSAGKDISATLSRLTYLGVEMEVLR